MKILFLLVLNLVNPDTHKLEIQYKVMPDAQTCVIEANKINKVVVDNNLTDTYAACVIDIKGKDV